MYEQPRVESLHPSFGWVVGGSEVTIVGQGLDASPSLIDDFRCKFGSSSVAGMVINDTAAVCVSPPGEFVGDDVGVEVSLNGGVDFTSQGD